MGTRLRGAEGLRRASTLLLLVVGVGVLAGGIAALWYYLSLPYAGFEFSGGGTIGAVKAGSPAAAAGLQVGDRVLAVDGQPRQPGAAYLWPHQRVLELTVQRGGEILTAALDLRPPTAIEALYTSGHYLTGLAFWLLAMAVLFLKPRAGAPRLLVILCLLAAIAIATWSLADLGLAWANLLMSAVVAVLGPVFVHYHTLFPEPGTFRGKTALVAGLYGISLVLLALSTASDLTYYLRLGQNGQVFPSLAPAIRMVFGLCAIVGLALLLRSYRVTRSAGSKRQVALVLLGNALALLPLIVLIAIPQVFLAPYLVPTWLTLLLILLAPLSYVYATYRKDWMRADRKVNRSVVLYLLALIYAGLYLALTLSVRQLVPGASRSTATAVDLIVILGLVIMHSPLRSRVQRSVDGVFYGGWYNYETVVGSMSEGLKDALDMGTTSRLLVDGLAERMRLKANALLVSRPDRTYRNSSQTGFQATPPVGKASSLAGLLLEVGKPISHAEVVARLGAGSAAAPELEAWSAAGAQIWVPLIQQAELVGLLVVGSKLADDFFYGEDQRILATVAQQGAAAVARVRLLEDQRRRIEETQGLSRRVMELEERNQQRMAEELHDRVVQDLVEAGFFLEDAQKQCDSEELQSAREVLQEMVRYLRSVLIELQPPAWEYSDLQTVLQDYVATRGPERGLSITLHVNGSSGDAPVPDQVRRAVFRIFQESLNNAWKHAQSKEVEVTLDLQPGELRLEVRDHGVGFDTAPDPDLSARGGHFGLLLMREKASEVGGTLQVDSQPGKGTRILLEVPLPKA